MLGNAEDEVVVEVLLLVAVVLAVALGSRVDVPWVPISMVTDPDVLVETPVAFAVAVESVLSVMVVVTEAYVTEPVAWSMVKASTVPDTVVKAALASVEVVEVEVAEVESEADVVVVESAQAAVSSTAAIQNDRIV